MCRRQGLLVPVCQSFRDVRVEQKESEHYHHSRDDVFGCMALFITFTIRLIVLLRGKWNLRYDNVKSPVGLEDLLHVFDEDWVVHQPPSEIWLRKRNEQYHGQVGKGTRINIIRIMATVIPPIAVHEDLRQCLKYKVSLLFGFLSFAGSCCCEEGLHLVTPFLGQVASSRPRGEFFLKESFLQVFPIGLLQIPLVLDAPMQRLLHQPHSRSLLMVCPSIPK
mmetsp:Transcript_16473/g.46457  ORF Transcript_16473/g.46457 Transcript_16473/m.46457 type:complete len:221 (-) Transcript_16473:306-968(-)